jgi:hypothetical protein
MSVDDVANQLWGTAPKANRGRPHDVAGLGPPPRDIDPRAIAYAKRAANSLAVFWLILAVFFGVGDTIMWFAGTRYVPLLTLGLLGLALYSFRRRARERAKILATLRDGTLHQAVITEIRAVERRGGRVKYYTYYVTFALPGKSITLVTRDAGVSLLQTGISEEVVWDERNPDVVVPTFLLA